MNTCYRAFISGTGSGVAACNDVSHPVLCPGLGCGRPRVQDVSGAFPHPRVINTRFRLFRDHAPRYRRGGRNRKRDPSVPAVGPRRLRSTNSVALISGENSERYPHQTRRSQKLWFGPMTPNPLLRPKHDTEELGDEDQKPLQTQPLHARRSRRLTGTSRWNGRLLAGGRA